MVLSAGIVIVRREKNTWKYLLLRAYRNWDFPKGEVEPGEDALRTAVREAKEETGITGIDLRQLATFGKPGRDPRGRQITVVFWGKCRLADFESQTKAGDDAAEAKWFDIESLDELKLAFDHKQVIELGIKTLKK